MRAVMTKKLVCEVCQSPTVQVTAWASFSRTGELVLEDDEGPLSHGWCPECGGERDGVSVPLSPEEQEEAERNWKRRAASGCSAMVLRSLDVLTLPVASHLVGNAMAPFILDPYLEDEELPASASVALSARVAADRQIQSGSNEYPYSYPGDDVLAPLLEEMGRIWNRALAGEVVLEDPLERLRRYVDPLMTNVDFKLRYTAGRWYVAIRHAKRVVARANHPLLAVAVELCLRLVVT